MEETEIIKIEEIEALLWAQEHRVFQVFYNFFITRPGLEKDDPRKKASSQALLWWFLSPGTIVTTGIGIVAVIGLVLAYQANGLFKEQNNTLISQTNLLITQNERLNSQNKLIENQNKYIRQQNILQDSARRSALVYELTSIMDEIDEELDAANIELKAVYTRNRRDEAGTKPSKVRPRLRSIENPPLYRLSTRLSGRIVAISRSLKPYRFLNSEGELLDIALSPERAQLLMSLMDSGIDLEELNGSTGIIFDQADLRDSKLQEYDFTHIKLNKADLSNSDISASVFHYAKMIGANLEKANVGYSDMRWSTLSYANFSEARLTGVKFEGAEMEGVNLSNSNMADSNFKNVNLKDSNLKGIKNWKTIEDISGSNINGILNAPAGFVEWAIENGAKKI